MKFLPSLLAALLFAATGLLAGPAEDLAVAEQNLRISQETLAQIESDLVSLKADPATDPGVVAEFEAYAARSRSIVESNRKRVDELRLAAPAKPAAPEPEAEFQVAKPQVDMRREIDEDPLAKLDRSLNRSVAEFDAKLLREMEEIAQARESGASGTGAVGAESPTGGEAGGGEGDGGEAGGGEAGGGELAEAGEPAGSEGAGEGEGSEEAGQPGMKPGGDAGNPQGGGEVAGNTEPGGDNGSSQTAGSPGASTPGGTAGNPDGRPRPGAGSRGGGEDDDIVARQLREAAEKETDPVLKEKLWKEYENYKRGR